MEQSVEEHSVTLDNAGLNLKWTSEDNDMNIHADPHLIARLMDNLLINLEKHARPRTTAHLDLVETSQGFEVSLSNAAPGFSPDNPDRLFGRMVKGDASRHDGDGSGLGLALCREIVLLHGGSIQIEAPGDLFVIRFVLPKAGKHSPFYPFMIRPESGK